MVVAVLFALTVLSVGYAVVSALRLGRGAIAAGLAPALGLALLAIVASWCVLLRAPPQLAGVAVYSLALCGLTLAIVDRRELIQAVSRFAREQPLAACLVVAALVLPFAVMGFALAGVEVPLSPHDGATHTETVQAYRLGHTRPGWYPPATAAIFAAWLQPFGWLDSAEGAFDLGSSLPSLAALAVFGLGAAVWRNLPMAALASLLLGFTYLYPYFPQLWSGWPLAMSLVLVIGMWSTALEYLGQPSLRWAVVAGLLVGATVLLHGTELYSLAIVLPILLIGWRGRVSWRALPRDIGVALAVGLGCAAVYVPTLLGWAATGGAYATGIEQSAVLSSTQSPGAASGPGLFGTFAIDSLGIDLPLRLVLVGAGSIWAFRTCVGRSSVAIGVAFAIIAIALNAFSGVAVFRQIYALTFPWGMHYRLLMLVSIAQVLLAGAGGVVLLRAVSRWASRPTAWARRLGRVTRILVVTWVVLSSWSMALFMAYPAGMVLGFGRDDGAAMAWLRRNAVPGDVVLNDGYADAGIWAPYKAGLAVLLPRSEPMPPDELARRTLVWQNVARLDQTPEVTAAACAEHVSFVYFGARVSDWDTRHFPPPVELRRSPALEEVFSQGEAAVFRTRLACPAD